MRMPTAISPTSFPPLGPVTSTPFPQSVPLLIQVRPRVTSIPESRPILPPGPLPEIEVPKYDTDDIIVIGPPNVSSPAYHDTQTLKVMDRIPTITDLPTFIYELDPDTRTLRRYLAEDERDLVYYDDPDPNYNISQEWLINSRQGDEPERLPERRPYPEIADEEAFNEQGVTTLNRGRIWYGPPRQGPIPISEFYEDYQRSLEYGQTLEEEDEDIT